MVGGWIDVVGIEDGLEVEGLFVVPEIVDQREMAYALSPEEKLFVVDALVRLLCEWIEGLTNNHKDGLKSDLKVVVGLELVGDRLGVALRWRFERVSQNDVVYDSRGHEGSRSRYLQQSRLRESSSLLHRKAPLRGDIFERRAVALIEILECFNALLNVGHEAWAILLIEKLGLTVQPVANACSCTVFWGRCLERSVRERRMPGLCGVELFGRWLCFCFSFRFAFRR